VIYRTDVIDKKIVSALLVGLKTQGEFLRSTRIRISDCNFMDYVSFDSDGYMALAQTKLFLTRGKMRILKANFLKSGIAMANTEFGKEIDYVFEANYSDNDFFITRFELTGYGAARALASGVVADYEDEVNLDLEGEIKSVLLDDILFLNNRNFSTKGFADIGVSVNGPIEKLATTTKVHFINCVLSAFDTISLKRIDSYLVWDGKDFSLKLSGYFNDAPLELTLEIDKRNVPQIRSQVTVKQIGAFQKTTANFQGYLLNKIIGGDLEVLGEYTEKKSEKKISVVFTNMYLNLEERNFQSNSLDLVWLGDPSGVQPPKSVSFSALSVDAAVKKDGFSLENCKASVYGGIVNGGADFLFDGHDLNYELKLYLQNLEVADFAKEFLSLGYQLSGSLSGTVALSSNPKKAVSGEVQIVGGQVKDNAVLSAVADFFDLPSLRTIDFDKLRINFLKTFGKYHAAINLFANDITIYLDNQFLENGVMDGYLSLRLSSKLMDASSRFSRLFKYIEYSEPTVYFPFNLKGYVDNPRIEWLQNEFKEKLENFLKDKHKKILQDQLNKLAQEFVR